MITKHPDQRSGDACVRDTGIEVWVVINYFRLGGSKESLLNDYPLLAAADLIDVAEYTGRNSEEIEDAIRDNEAE